MTANNSLDLGIEDKVAFIQGGAGDIGEVIVGAFARQNAKVVIADLNVDRAQEIAKGIEESDVSACLLDTTSEDSIKNAVDFAIKNYGTIDVLVNVAGLLCRKPFFETTKQDFEESLSVNVTGMFLVSREVSEIMRDNRSGSIINISSINGKLAVENRVVFWYTKKAGYIRTKKKAHERAPADPISSRASWAALIFPVILLALLTLTIGLGAESLLLLASRAAEQLMDPTEYISRVLGEMR